MPARSPKVLDTGDLDDEILLDVADRKADLLILGGTREHAGTHHLDLECAEAEVMDVLYAVLECAPLAGKGDSGRTEPYHIERLTPKSR